VIRSELRQAILLVLGEADRAQRHRFDGRMYLVVPREEGLHDYWTWIADETREAAAASIRGEPYPPATYDALRKCVLVSSDVVAELSDPATDPRSVRKPHLGSSEAREIDRQPVPFGMLAQHRG
jgi:hypothetical protein